MNVAFVRVTSPLQVQQVQDASLGMWWWGRFGDKEATEPTGDPLHEQPHSATSWHEKCIIEIAEMPGVIRTHAHMCQYGMKLNADGKILPVMKPTGFLTNSPYMASELSRRCPGNHVHATLMAGLSRSGEEPPRGRSACPAAAAPCAGSTRRSPMHVAVAPHRKNDVADE